jgi:hypothetical protein
MTAMEEGLDIDKIMLGLGFSKEHDAIGEGYGKEIVLCNSNCIGCEYKISFGIRICKGGTYDVVGIMYKPLVRDSEIHIGKDGSMSDQPHSRIFILNTERGDIENAVYDCAHTLAQVMTAMDFQQISGTDFINLSDCSREEIMNEFDKQSYTNIYVPFNPSVVPCCSG